MAPIKSYNASLFEASVKADVKIPKQAAGREWLGIYRDATGACAAGIRSFVKETSFNPDGIYTREEIVEKTRGYARGEKFEKQILQGLQEAGTNE